MAPSAERLAGTGLAIAAITILALALLARFELDREGTLHRDVIAALEVKDSLEALRIQLNDLRAAARLVRVGGDRAAAQAIERRSVEIDAELEYLAQQPLRQEAGPAFNELEHASRLIVLAARSPAADVDRHGAEADAALERMLRVQRRRISESTIAQIRVGDTLRTYVSWLVAGSIAVLVGLFGFYRWAKAREARAMQRIEHLAHHDTVTGLPNRALLTDRLAQESARARRAGETFAVLLLDLDGFKAVNDTWGHAADDQVLARVADRLRGCMRASDTVGRLGGDEFLALLPQTTESGAALVAEKIRAALSEPYAFEGFTARVGASVGMAMFPREGEEGEALQKAADAALYEAKRGGKNRVVRAGASAAPQYIR